MTPQRLRLSRAKGFDLQAASLALNGLPAVNCARPSMWGNPFEIGHRDDDVEPTPTAEAAVKQFAAALDLALAGCVLCPARLHDRFYRMVASLGSLRGKNLACWCRIWQCPKCKQYCDQWGDSPGPNCACGMLDNKTDQSGTYTVMHRVPCHCDVLLKIANP